MAYIGTKPADKPLTAADITDSIITSAKIVDATITNSDVASSIITGQTAETSIAGGDSVLIYDDSASALRKMTRTNFVSGIGGTNTPAFEAYTTAAQSVTEETNIKLTFATEVFDSNSNYDNSTNYRFTPTTAGKYFVYSKAQTDPSAYANDKLSQLMIYKNGSYVGGYGFSEIMTGANSSGEGATATMHNITNIIDMNGTTDYLEIYFYFDTWSNSGATAKNKVFGAFKLIGA
jgi:hypothetical protein